MEQQYDVEDLNLVTPIYSLIEYSSNYCNTTGSLWFCSKDGGTNFNADVENNKLVKSFGYKVKLLDNTVADGFDSILKMQYSLHHQSILEIFLRSLEMPFINYNVN